MSTPTPLDASAPVRQGEELPLAALEAYLNARLPEAAGPLSVDQFPHGFSNLTYLLRAGGAELVLRRGPLVNRVKTAHDMGREYRVLSRLCTMYPPAPRPLLYCDDPGILGVPFYVMERRRGVVLRKELPPGLTIDPETARRLSTTLIDQLALLHGLDYRAGGLADLGKPEGYVARQVRGWAERHAQARTDDVPGLERAAAWLGANVPAESGAALIHNDYKYDNLLLDAGDLTRIVAVLDWEMATLGDPLMDLGTTLGYWVEAGDPAPLQHAATGPTMLPGSLTRRELVERYQERAGCPVAGAVYYYVFGLFKIAVIIQQIYARYVAGHTRDARFARLDAMVRALADQAEWALGENALSRE
jgi:aminoglycoside phosphotransferase (APT) family kinase protein